MNTINYFKCCFVPRLYAVKLINFTRQHLRNNCKLYVILDVTVCCYVHWQRQFTPYVNRKLLLAVPKRTILKTSCSREICSALNYGSHPAYESYTSALNIFHSAFDCSFSPVQKLLLFLLNSYMFNIVNKFRDTLIYKIMFYTV